MGSITIDETYNPIYLVTYHGSVSDEQFRGHLAAMGASMSRSDSGPRVVIQDGRGILTTPATQRRMQAEWMRENDRRIRELNMGTVFVLDSALARGALTAILWLYHLPMPHHVCGELPSAVDWCEQILQARNLTLAPGTREHLVRVGEAKSRLSYAP